MIAVKLWDICTHNSPNVRLFFNTNNKHKIKKVNHIYIRLDVYKFKQFALIHQIC